MPDAARGGSCRSLDPGFLSSGKENLVLSGGVTMTGKRNIGGMAGIGGLSAAIALLTGLPAVSADELADLRANQELLQKRIDQLSQAPPPGTSGPYVPGFGPETR